MKRQVVFTVMIFLSAKNKMIYASANVLKTSEKTTFFACIFTDTAYPANKMNFLTVYFSVSDVETSIFIPPLIAFVISFFPPWPE
jgi:hypothetical protein